MPRNLTFRCSKETAKRIETALAVRGSGLFPIHPRDPETSEEAAMLDAILGQWMADLKEKHLTPAREPRAFATGYGSDPLLKAPSPAEDPAPAPADDAATGQARKKTKTDD